MRNDLREQAVAAYIEPPAEGGFGALDAESAEESVNKRVFLDLQGSSSADVLDQLRGAQARLAAQRDGPGRRLASRITAAGTAPVDDPGDTAAVCASGG